MTRLRSSRRLAAIGVVVLGIFGSVAFAFFTSSGAGTASASVGTLGAPSNVTATATAGSGTVPLSWTASPSIGGVSPQGYYLLRHSAGGTVAACTTSPSSLTTATTCNDVGVPDGTYTYTVVAKLRGFTASADSNSVTVVNDNAAPTVTLTTPANGSVTNSTTPTLSGAAGNATGDLTTVTVRIYSGTGTGGSLLQTIPVTRSGAAWTTNAAVLAAGIYTVQATQADLAGNIGTSSANTFTIDTTAPAVTLTTPADASTTNDSTPTLAGAAGNATGDSATVTVKIHHGNTTGGAVAQTVPVTRSGATWTVDAAALGDGTYTAQATQTDAAGNTGTSTANTFLVDTTAPVVTLTTPANGSTTSSTTPAISGAAGNLIGDSNTVTVRIYSGTGIGGSLLQTIPVTRSAGTWSTSAATLGQGTYTVQATQTDAGGNIGTSSANTFVVDATAPTVTVNQKAGQADPTNTTPMLWTVTFSEPVTGFDSTDLTRGGTATGGTVGVTATGATTYEISLTGTPTNGTTTFTIAAARAQDGAGNSNTASTSTDNSVTYDTVAPTVTVNQKAGQADPTNATPMLWTVTFSEPVTGFDATDVTRGGTTSGGSVGVTATGATTYEIALTGSPTNGTTTFTIAAARAQDAAGNNNAASTSTDNSVTYDTVAPTLTLVAPANNSFTNDTTPDLNGAAGNAIGDSTTVTVKIYNGTGTGGTVNQTLSPTRTGATWTTTATTLAEGTYTAQATQTDTAGNSTASTANTFTVDTTAPVLQSVTTTPGSTLNRMQAGDSFVLTFSEPIANFPASATVTEARSGGSTLTIPGLIGSAPIDNSYLAANNSSGASTVTPVLSGGNTTITLTLGTIATTGSGPGTGTTPTGVTVTPAPTLADRAGNLVTNTSRSTSALF